MKRIILSAIVSLLITGAVLVGMVNILELFGYSVHDRYDLWAYFVLFCLGYLTSAAVVAEKYEKILSHINDELLNLEAKFDEHNKKINDDTRK